MNGGSVPERIVLHIGPMKTGTTFLQAVLNIARPDLEAAGWRYPATFDRAGPPNHQRALYGVVGTQMPWVPPKSVAHYRPLGRRLLDEVRAWSGPVIVSAESMAQLSKPGIDVLLRELGGSSFDVIITARALSRVIPSAWQQRLRAGWAGTIDERLALLERTRDATDEYDPHLRFWTYQRLPHLVERWSNAVDPNRVVVAVVPASPDPTILWRRFRTAANLPDTMPDVPPEVPRDAANIGMTAPEAVLLHAMVEQMTRDGIPPRRRRYVIRRLFTDVLLRRDDRGESMRIPAAWIDKVRAWSNEDVDAVIAKGTRIVGDVDELRAIDEKGQSTALATQVASAAAVALLRVRPPAAHRAVPQPPPRRSRIAGRLRAAVTGKAGSGRANPAA
jgi:hypothetical protein